jgi:hypothetical protein
MQTRHHPSGEEPPATIPPRPPRGSRRQPTWKPARALVPLLTLAATDSLYDAQTQLEEEREEEHDTVILSAEMPAHTQTSQMRRTGARTGATEVLHDDRDGDHGAGTLVIRRHDQPRHVHP